MQNILAVIFDMDGLLVDSEPIHFRTNQEFWKRYGKKFDGTHLQRFMGKRLTEEIEELCREWNIAKSPGKLLAERESLFLALAKDSLTLTRGARRLLTFLQKKKMPVALGTSSQKPYVDFVMTKFGIRKYFQSLVTAEHVSRGKPDPEVYLLASKLLSVPPANCVVLEDALNGIAAAKAAGMMCVAVPGPYIEQKNFLLQTRCFPHFVKYAPISPKA